MNLTPKLVNLDIDVLQKLKKLDPNLNLSELIRDFLRRKVDFMASGLAYDRHKLQKEYDTLKDKHDEISAKLTEYIKQIDLIKEQEQKDQEKAEIAEQERQLKTVTCVICDIPKPAERMHDSNKGLVCNGCFRSCEPKLLKEYFGGKNEPKGKSATK